MIGRKPIIEKVHFLNGDHRVIEFDAAATCVEVTYLHILRIQSYHMMSRLGVK